MHHLQKTHEPHLFRMLICLTFLFIAAQLAFFFAHYKVSQLIDTLTNSSISHHMLHPIILLPIFFFIAISLLIYLIATIWIWFIARSVGDLFDLSEQQIYGLGILCWCLGCVEIMGLNAIYFPHSFFAGPFHEYVWLAKMTHSMLITTSFLWLVFALLAYVHFFKSSRYRFIGSGFLLLGFLFGAMTFYDRIIPPASIKSQHMPHVIFIGLDSLRPDFIHYLSARPIQTPHIDHFMQTATVFSQAYTPLSRTFPAWMSILTGMYPKHHEARNNLIQPAQVLRHETLALRLHNAGYKTIYATDERRFSNVTKDYGFDEVIGPALGVNDFLLGGLMDFPLTNLLINSAFGRYLFPYHYGNRAAHVTYEPNTFLQLLKNGLMTEVDQPIFLSVHLCLTHWPFGWAQNKGGDETHLPERYQQSVEAIDAQLGKLFLLLKKAGLLKHSIVVLLSDHGTALGLLHDRVISENNFLGDQKALRLMTLMKLSSAKENSIDFKRDYTLSTSYGQGTDVLSLNQNHILLAFKGFGFALPSHQSSVMSSLLDIAPTVLDLLHLAPMAQADGVSLKQQIENPTTKTQTPRAFFLESGASLSEIETDHIYIEKVVKHEIGIYDVNPANGFLYLTNEAEASLVKNKQRAILRGDWMLALYPGRQRYQLVPKSDDQKNEYKVVVSEVSSYFVLVNVKTGKWTLDLASSYAKKAPVKALMEELKKFYGNEIPSLPQALVLLNKIR